MDEGKDREKNKGCVCGCKTYTPGIMHEIQDNLSLEAFAIVRKKKKKTHDFQIFA